jgi:hypothetical protein
MLKTIGSVARFVLTRYRRCTVFGPYAVITVEVRPARFQTRVFWGEEGRQVAYFGTASAKGRDQAYAAHVAACMRVAYELHSRNPHPDRRPPAA